MTRDEIVRRAVATAVQAGLAVLVAAGTDWVSVGVWKAAGIAAGAGLISALHRFTQTLVGSEPSEA